MLQFGKSIMVRTFDHPIIAFNFVLAVVLAIIGGVLTVAGFLHPIVHGFFGVYSVFFAGIGVIGYAVLLTYKAITIVWDRMGPVAQ